MENRYVNYVTPEIAKSLKEIGFDEPCNGSYSIALKSRRNKQDGNSGPFGWKKGETTFDRSYFRNFWKECDYSGTHWLQVAAPLIQHAFRWFRDTHKLRPVIDSYYPKKNKLNYYFIIKFPDDNPPLPYNSSDYELFYEKHEEAELACLEKLIELVKQKKK